ncbi:MAG: hypothetical protein JZD41_02315 [Thermoproteus sp.]|nr:hypothetical protein [Thermoproteus sp.]
MDKLTARLAKDHVLTSLEPEFKKYDIYGVGITTLKHYDHKGLIELRDDWGIVFYVDKKRNDGVIPKEIQYGGKRFWTDVIEVPGGFSTLPLITRSNGNKVGSACARSASEPTPVVWVPEQECACHRSRCRPVRPGLSICDCELTACSFTGIFQDASGKIYFVTNAHCTKYIRTCNKGDLCCGRPFSQPGPYDGGNCNNDFVGKNVKASDITQPGSTDTTLIEPAPGVTFDMTIHGAGIKLQGGKYRVPNPGEQIMKSGRTTGVTSGTVKSIHTDVDVDYGCLVRRVTDTIITTNMGAPGDSGSVGFDQNGVWVGQLFAGSYFETVFISPENIFKEFGILPYPFRPGGGVGGVSFDIMPPLIVGAVGGLLGGLLPKKEEEELI